MPNWVYCNVTVEGPAEDMARFKKAASKANRYYSTEKVTDWGAFTDIQLSALMQEAEAHSLSSNEEGFCFNALYPVPFAVQVLPYDPGTLDRCIRENEGIRSFCDIHDVNISGYDWEHQNWGVKWGDCSTSVQEVSDTHMSIYFETAWGPAHEFWEKVSADYPTLTIIMDYTEEMNQFAGEAVFTNGVMELSEWQPKDEDEEDDGIVEGAPE
jgi:hypothetical protein